MLLLPVCMRAQVALYSMPNENDILLNPALVGSTNQIRTGLFYRNQWLNIKSPFQTYGFVFDMRIGEFATHAIGFSATNNVQGMNTLQHTQLMAYYSFTFDVTYEFRMRVGLSVGTMLKTVNYNGLIFPDMVGRVGVDPGYRNRTQFAPDVATGIIGEWRDWTFGISGLHLAEPSYDFRKLERIRVPRQLTIHLSKKHNIYRVQRFHRPLYLIPQIYVTWLGFPRLQDAKIVAVACLQVEYMGVRGGLGLRESILHSRHDVVMSVGYEGNRFGVMYAYSLGFMPQGFNGLNSSIHEIALKVKFNYKDPRFRKKSRGLVRYSSKRAAAARRRALNRY